MFNCLKKGLNVKYFAKSKQPEEETQTANVPEGNSAQKLIEAITSDNLVEVRINIK